MMGMCNLDSVSQKLSFSWVWREGFPLWSEKLSMKTSKLIGNERWDDEVCKKIGSQLASLCHYTEEPWSVKWWEEKRRRKWGDVGEEKRENNLPLWALPSPIHLPSWSLQSSLFSIAWTSSSECSFLSFFILCRLSKGERQLSLRFMLHQTRTDCSQSINHPKHIPNTAQYMTMEKAHIFATQSKVQSVSLFVCVSFGTQCEMWKCLPACLAGEPCVYLLETVHFSLSFWYKTKWGRNSSQRGVHTYTHTHTHTFGGEKRNEFTCEWEKWCDVR